jgi:hypothetical protein
MGVLHIPGKCSRLAAMRAISISMVLALLLIGCKGESSTEAPAEPPTDAAAEPATDPAAEAQAGFGVERVRDVYADSAAGPLPGCERVWAANLVADEADEVICVVGNELSIYGADGDDFRLRATLTGTGLVNATWSGDRDGDGRIEFMVAFGMGRGFPAGPMRLIELDAEPGGAGWQVHRLFDGTGGRPQITAVAWGPEVYLAHYVSKYEVEGGWLKPDGTLAGSRRIHMGTSHVLADLDGDGDRELAVGRVYGDEPRSDGDLTVYAGDVATPVTTFRGVKTLVPVDLDGDGTDELLFGDGWHFRYKDEGKGRLNLARRAADGTFTTTMLHELPGQFAVSRIELADLDGDGTDEILAVGTDHLYGYRRGASLERWEVIDLGDCAAADFAPARRADGSLQIAIAGSPVTWLRP